ncbi:PREDICTED: traB domain-containing protein-like [Tarenaya hassleriana]|uniref:traB domain-containing protein-like n=1 Tax=Tarenaya hassleriana TaxID=28532 RepID=UPI00053CA274|nr:PREDICTED: traB domain-containing protein-like [Tarenaya hassleriana]
MEPAQPSPEPDVPSGEDFVHIDDPRPDADVSLSDSIVNVEKEELLQEAEEEKGEDSDGDSSSSSSSSDSGISGGDALGVGGGDDIAGGVDDGGERRSQAEKVELPEELARSVMVLTCESTAEGGSCDVYLVGTAHVSQDSCREVEAVVRLLKPQVVFLELCSSRLSILKPQTLKVPTMAEMIDMWKKKHNAFGIMYSWFLAKIASTLEVFPGAEFRVAFEEAVKYGGKVVLGDRPVQITVRRTWAMMPLWHKAKFVYSLVFQAMFLPSPEELNKLLKVMDDVDMLTLVIQEMSKEFPSLMDTLVRERDQYMASSLLKVASEHSSVVAVVGKGHLQGIKENWKQPITMKDLMEIPKQKPFFTAKKILTSLAVAVAGTAIVSGIYLASKR